MQKRNTLEQHDMQVMDKPNTNTGATERYQGFRVTVSKVKVQGST